MGRLIGRKRVLAKSKWCRGWVLGTLYVHDHDIRFEPEFSLRTTAVATHLTWPRVSAIRLRGGGPFGTIEVAHRGGAEIYRCFGAERFARLLSCAHSSFERLTELAA